MYIPTKEEEDNQEDIEDFYKPSNICFLITTYIISELKKKSRTFKIGLASIFLVVSFLIIVQTSVQISYLIFISLSEKNAGDIDVVFEVNPNSTLVNPFSLINARDILSFDKVSYLNLTDSEFRIANRNKYTKLCPRWKFTGTIQNASSGQSTPVNILFINSSREQESMIGSLLDPSVLVKNEAVVSNQALKFIGIEPLQKNVSKDIFIQLNLSDIFLKMISDEFGIPIGTELNPIVLKQGKFGLYGKDTQNISLNYTYVSEYFYVKKVITVISSTENSRAKWPSSYGNVVLLDYSTSQEWFRNFILNINSTLSYSDFANLTGGISQMQFKSISQHLNFLSQRDQEEYSSTMNMRINNRIEYYSSSIKDLNLFFLSLSQELGQLLVDKKLDFQFSFPIFNQLLSLDNYSIILNVIFFSTTVILIILSIILIYSLLISDVEERTYDFSMLQALGLRKFTIILILLSESLCVAFPALAISFAFSYTISSMVYYIIFVMTNHYAVYNLTLESSLIGVGIGLLVPIASNIFPIRRALSKSLSEGLKPHRNMLVDYEIIVSKLKNLGASLSEIIVGITMIGCGFVTYFLVPYSMTFNNMKIFYYSMNIILLIMVFGIIIVFHLISPYIQIFLGFIITKLIFCFDSKIFNLLKTNIKSHSPRNSKTDLMFSFSLGFLIFVASSFSNSQDVLLKAIYASIGSDILVYNTARSEYLNENLITQYLEQQKKAEIIYGYSFISKDLIKTINPYKNATEIVGYIAPFSSYPLSDSNLQIYAVGKNFLQIADLSYFVPSEYEKLINEFVSEKPDIVSYIYSTLTKDENEKQNLKVIDSNNITSGEYDNFYKKNLNVYSKDIRGIIPQAFKTPLSLEAGNYSTLKISSSNPSTKFKIKIAALPTKMPVFSFSGFSIRVSFPTLIISFDDYKAILDFVLSQNSKNLEDYNSLIEKAISNNGIPKDGIIIKFINNLSENDKLIFLNGLKSLVPIENTLIYFKDEYIQNYSTTIEFLQAFLIVVSAVSLILSSFLLFISNLANIRESRVELGILKSIGVSNNQLIRVYLYEVLCIVFGSILIGITTGIIISFTMMLNVSSILELPFNFTFPWILVTIMCCFSLLSAFAGSYYPISKITELSISNALKAE